jgi:uncharacterized protein DUF6125
MSEDRVAIAQTVRRGFQEEDTAAMAPSKHQMEVLSTFSREQLLELIDIHQKSWWNLQNHWSSYLEGEYGMEAAVRADRFCFPANARLQVFRLKKLLGLGNDLESLRKALVLSTIWANGEYDITTVGDTLRIRVTRCPQQMRRVADGAGEFACKPAGIAISEAAARAVNPGCRVRCVLCPPDQHPKDVWCEWQFELSSHEPDRTA